MKNIISLFAVLLVLSTNHLQAQTWSNFKIDKKTFVKTPTKFTIQKTKESTTYFASTGEGAIMIVKMALPKGAKNENIQINVKTKLTRVDKGQSEGVSVDVKNRENTTPENEEIVEETESIVKIVEIDGVEGQAMINKIEMAEGVFMWQRSITCFHNGSIYIFNYMEQVDGEEYVASNTANTFFNNISFKKVKKRK